MDTKKQLGLGDAIARIAKVLHIPHCKKCEQRRLILNEIRTLGVKETLKRLKAVGLSTSHEKKTSESWSVEEIVKKMEDCCDEK